MNASRDQLAALDAVEAYAGSQVKRLRKAIVTTIIVYLALAVIVLGYTSWAIGAIRQATSKEALSDFARAFLLQKLPETREAIMARYKSESGDWAKLIVSECVSKLPLVENTVQLQLETWTNALAEQVERDMLSGFTVFLRESGPDLRERYKDLTDKDAIRGVALIFADMTEQELNKLVNDKFMAAFEEMQQSLQEISKPNAQLTKRQDAVRRLIAYAVYLSENDKVREQVFSQIVDSLAGTIKSEWQLDFLDNIRLDFMNKIAVPKVGGEDEAEGEVISEEPLPLPEKKPKK